MRTKSFKVLFQLNPAGLFGLPEDGTTVVAGKQTKGFVGPVIDTRTLQFVSHGKFSEYRREEDAIKVSGTIADSKLEVSDNFFWLTVQSSSLKEGLKLGVARFEHFVRLLEVEQGSQFTFDIVQIESEDGETEVRPGMRPIKMLRLTGFDLDGLRAKIASAARNATCDDERLAKALLYHEHALFLFDLRLHVGFASTHFSFLLTSAYLTMWKAITTILGDPSIDRDYQRRHVTFGLPRGYWKECIRPLYEVRNSYDVAHYSLDSAAVQRVEESFSAASRICREVIKVYVNYLQSAA